MTPHDNRSMIEPVWHWHLVRLADLMEDGQWPHSGDRSEDFEERFPASNVVRSHSSVVDAAAVILWAPRLSGFERRVGNRPELIVAPSARTILEPGTRLRC